MAVISLRDWRARSAARVESARRVKAQLSVALDLAEDDVLSVSEIACAEPGCPDMETIVLVMRMTRPTRAFRIRRPLDAVNADDIARVVAEERAPDPAA